MGSGSGQVQARTFRYDTAGRWFKGNTHIHSVASDGGLTFAELADRYAEVGYDFLFRTDHRVASRVADDPAAYPLVWFDGVELDGPDETGAQYHVVCLGTFDGISKQTPLVEGMRVAREQGGMLVLAHPFWTGNSLEDARRHGFDGVEVYNHVCRWLNGKGEALVHWNDLLHHRPGTLALAADDTHAKPGHPSWNGGWVVVNAPSCARNGILGALLRGNYYSSCGPEFFSIEMAGSTVSVTTSPVRSVRLVGPAWRAQRCIAEPGEQLTAATLEVPPDWEFAYLEIEDDLTRRAWTNTLFLP